MKTIVWDQESGLTAGKILPKDGILEFLYKYIDFPLMLSVIARIGFLFSSSFGLTTILKRITVVYELNYFQILSIWATVTAMLFAAEGRFIGTKWNRSGDMTVKNIDCLLPSLLLSLLVGLIFEGVYMLLLYKQEPCYNEIIQDMDSDDEEEDTSVKIPRERFQGKHLLCSWTFFWYLLLFGTDSFLKSISKSALENQYEYVGPMRLTKMPSLYYSNVTYDSGGDMLKLFPCMHDTRIKRYVYNQPSVQITLEIGWGYSWGCRSNEDSKRWNTNWPNWNECTSFICRSDGISSCPCYRDEASARNASFSCINNVFNLTLLEKGATFDKKLPPWEDELGWPTLVRYGKCEGNVGFSMDTEFVDEYTMKFHLYHHFGACSILVCTILAFDGCRRRRNRYLPEQVVTTTNAIEMR